jgi:parallel beta-helix repeat protein
MNAITYVGIHVKGGGSNSFTGNTLVNNMAGMIFRDSSHNMINGNDVTCGANSWNLYDNVGGILFANSSNNTIYHNNFRIYYSNHAGDTFNSINVWDDGFPGGGNYWSDYLTKYPRAQMIGGSGIGNLSYVIDSKNIDRFPLMEEFAQFQIFINDSA